MLEDLLNAYDKLGQEKISFKNRIKKLNVIDKIILMTILIGMIAIIILCYFSVLVAALFSIAYTLALWIMIWISESFHNKRWKQNIEQYNDALSRLKNILTEYDLYEKNKIKQLIYKYKQEANDIEKELNKWDDIYTELKVSYAIPFIAFVAGKIGNDLSLNDIIILAFFAMICLLLLKVIFAGIKAINIDMRNDPVGRRKRFVKKLQDLLDREFEILNEDLLK